MGNCLSRFAKQKTTPRLLALSREIRNSIYSHIPRDLNIEWLWDTQGTTGTNDPIYDVIQVTFYNAPEPGVLAACTRLHEEMLEQDQLHSKELSVSITMLTRATIPGSTEEVEEMQQKQHEATRARIKTGFRKVLHATICIRDMTPIPSWGPSSTTRLLRWSLTNIHRIQTLRLALCHSSVVRDEKLTREILPRDPRNQEFPTVFADPMVVLQRGWGLRIGCHSMSAASEWSQSPSRRIIRHDLDQVYVYMYARSGVGRESLSYWTVEDIVEYFPVAEYNEALLRDVSGETADRVRGYLSRVVNWFEQRRSRRSANWVAV